MSLHMRDKCMYKVIFPFFFDTILIVRIIKIELLKIMPSGDSRPSPPPARSPSLKVKVRLAGHSQNWLHDLQKSLKIENHMLVGLPIKRVLGSPSLWLYGENDLWLSHWPLLLFCVPHKKTEMILKNQKTLTPHEKIINMYPSKV